MTTSSELPAADVVAPEENHTQDPEQNATSVRKLSSLLYLAKYLKLYRGRWIGAMVALVFTASITLLLGQGIRYLIDAGFSQQSLDLLDQAVILLLSITILLSVGTYVRYYLVSWLGERVSADIRQDVFDHIVTLHPGYFELNRSGEIASRITTDTTLLQTIIGSSFSMALRSSLTTTGGLIMLLFTNIKLTSMIFLSVPLVVFPLILFGRRVKKLARDSQDSIADVGSYAGEIIQNIKTVQSFTQEDYERKSFSRHVERAFEIARRRIRQRSFLMASVFLLVFSLLSIMLWVGGRDVINGAMTAGDLAAFVFYALLVAMGVATLSEVFGELQRAAGATERLVELLHVQRLIDVPDGVAGEDSKAKNDERGAAELRIDGVTFSYPSRLKQKALDNLSLKVADGSCIALVGSSGAGKSTLFELIQRFYDPQQGGVYLDGHDIRMLTPQALRRQIGVVAQHPALFTTDVVGNIRYGNPEATEEEVVEAAKAAYAHDFIMALPNGYQSFLGEQGVRLSGGQKQRIAIARAILKNPRILLLDEATSALDSESEYQVQQALDELMKDRTTLIIAHRLSTIQHADKIVVLEHGKIIAEGSHDSLLKDSPRYARLASFQFRGDVVNGG